MGIVIRVLFEFPHISLLFVAPYFPHAQLFFLQAISLLYFDVQVSVLVSSDCYTTAVIL